MGCNAAFMAAADGPRGSQGIRAYIHEHISYDKAMYYRLGIMCVDSIKNYVICELQSWARLFCKSPFYVLNLPNSQCHFTT